MILNYNSYSFRLRKEPWSPPISQPFIKSRSRDPSYSAQERTDCCCSVMQSLSRVRLFATPWAAARHASLSFTISRSSLKLMTIESVMPSNHLILCRPFSSHLQFFPASGSFPMSRLFSSGGQRIGASASASVPPVNIQGWFPLVGSCNTRDSLPYLSVTEFLLPSCLICCYTLLRNFLFF